MHRGKIKGLFVIVAVIVIIYLASQVGEEWNPAGIRNYIESFGMFAPLLFLLLSALRPVFFMPASVLGFAGGLLFGLWGGVALTVIGSLLAATLGYYLAQYLGGQWIERKMQGGRLLAFRNQLLRYGFYYVLFLRLTPIVSFDLISYICGFARIPFPKYMAATAIAIWPGTIFFTLMGTSVAAGDVETLSIILGSALLIFIVGTIYYAGKRRARNG